MGRGGPVAGSVAAAAAVVGYRVTSASCCSATRTGDCLGSRSG